MPWLHSHRKQEKKMIELSDRDKVLLSYIRDNRDNPNLADGIVKLITQSYRDWKLWHRIVLNSDPNDPRHGTDTAYSYGCKCDRCKEAHRIENARRRKKQSAQNQAR